MPVGRARHDLVAVIRGCGALVEGRDARRRVRAREHVVQGVDRDHVAARVPELDLVVIPVVVDRADHVHITDSREALQSALHVESRGLAGQRCRGMALEAQSKCSSQRCLARPHALHSECGRRARPEVRLPGFQEGSRPHEPHELHGPLVAIGPAEELGAARVAVDLASGEGPVGARRREVLRDVFIIYADLDAIPVRVDLFDAEGLAGELDDVVLLQVELGEVAAHLLELGAARGDPALVAPQSLPGQLARDDHLTGRCQAFQGFFNATITFSGRVDRDGVRRLPVYAQGEVAVQTQ